VQPRPQSDRREEPGAGAREAARLSRALEDGVTGAFTSSEPLTAWATPMDWTDKDYGNSK